MVNNDSSDSSDCNDCSDSSDSNDCSVCLTENILPTNKCITECNHQFCKGCLDGWFNKGKITCPMCRKPLQYYNYNGENIRIISIEKYINRPIILLKQNITNLIWLLVNSSIEVVFLNKVFNHNYIRTKKHQNWMK